MKLVTSFSSLSVFGFVALMLAVHVSAEKKFWIANLSNEAHNQPIDAASSEINSSTGEEKLNNLVIDGSENTEELFEEFQLFYGRKYATHEERLMRLNIFQEKLKQIAELNRNEKGTAVYGITEFSDYSNEELKTRGGLLQPKQDLFNYANMSEDEIPDVELPESFDWREKGVVTKVKDQGKCGSCWAFAAVGNIESLNAIKTKELLTFSEQQLLDCDKVDKACNGGMEIHAYRELNKMGGLVLESDYPYKAKRSRCQLKKNSIRVKVKGGKALPKDEDQMQQWLFANGPISIGVNVSPWVHYKNGIVHLDSSSCKQHRLNHAMLIVGFGVEKNAKTNQKMPFWIIKNSWGERWGENGYARVYRGSNVCGIKEDPTTAIL